MFYFQAFCILSSRSKVFGQDNTLTTTMLATKRILH